MRSGAGYTHTSLRAEPGERAEVGVWFYLDGRAWFSVPGAGTDALHLHISHGDVTVRFCPADPDAVTGEDARLARELADKAAEYAAEVERLHAASTAGEGGDAAA